MQQACITLCIPSAHEPWFGTWMTLTYFPRTKKKLRMWNEKKQQLFSQDCTTNICPGWVCWLCFVFLLLNFSPQAVMLSLKKTGEPRLLWDKSSNMWLIKDIKKLEAVLSVRSAGDNGEWDHAGNSDFQNFWVCQIWFNRTCISKPKGIDWELGQICTFAGII